MKTAPAPQYRFSHHDRLRIRGIAYVGNRFDRRGYTFRRADDMGMAEAFTFEEVHALLQSGEMVHEPDFFRAGSAALRPANEENYLNDLPDAERQETLWRVDFCDEVVKRWRRGEVHFSDRSIERALDGIIAAVESAERFRLFKGKRARCGTKLNGLAPPSAAMLRKWVRAYIKSGFDPLSMAPGRHRRGSTKSKLDPDVLPFLYAAARKYASDAKPTLAAAHETLDSDIKAENRLRALRGEPPLAVPSVEALRKAVKDMNPYLLMVAREGQAAARAKFGPVVEGLDVTAPMERVEIDEWEVDLASLMKLADEWKHLSPEQKKVVEKGRMWLTVAICTATRCIPAMFFHEEAPCSDTAVAAIGMMVSDKTELLKAAGIRDLTSVSAVPGTLVSDGGSSFNALRTRAVVADMKSNMITAPAGLPEMRGTVERVFRTHGDRFIAHIPGRTQSNVVERGDYKSEDHACLCKDEIARILLRRVFDCYHNTPHEGLAGETPLAAWKRLTAIYGVRPPLAPNRFRHIFGKQLERKIGDRGIRLFGLHYQSIELQKLRQIARDENVRVRVDLRDLGAISVGVGRTWTTVRYNRRGMSMEGVTYAEWAAACATLARRHADVAALSEATVDAAIRDQQTLVDAATRRAGIASPIITAEALERAERELFKPFVFADRGESAEDVLGSVVDDEVEAEPVPTALPAVPTQQTVPPSENDDWGTEE